MIRTRERVHGLVPAFRERVEWGLSYAEAYGASLTVTSGKRSSQEQRRLYELFKAGKGHPANAPGTSAHEFGLAVDVAADDPRWYPSLHSLWRALGLAVPYSREPWHVEVPNWQRYVRR